MIFKIFSGNRTHKLLSFNFNHFVPTRNIYESHYEVLKLSRNCTAKEIKDSFIKLSKEYHPDINAGKAAHRKFVEIAEAYNVLSKPHLRRDYDLGLSTNQNERTRSQRTYYDDASEGPWADKTFWSNRDKSQDKYYESQPYYGIKGLKRVPNGIIALLCVLFACIGIGLQIVVVRNSFTLRRDAMIRRSKETEEVLADLRKDALLNGNSIQIQRLKQRMIDNSIYKSTDDD